MYATSPYLFPSFLLGQKQPAVRGWKKALRATTDAGTWSDDFGEPLADVRDDRTDLIIGGTSVRGRLEQPAWNIYVPTELTIWQEIRPGVEKTNLICENLMSKLWFAIAVVGTKLPLGHDTPRLKAATVRGIVHWLPEIAILRYRFCDSAPGPSTPGRPGETMWQSRVLKRMQEAFMDLISNEDRNNSSKALKDPETGNRLIEYPPRRTDSSATTVPEPWITRFLVDRGILLREADRYRLVPELDQRLP